MRPVEIHEIVDLERYAEVRPSYREAVIRHKADRRLPVGENVTLVFEDRETLRFQIQEMVWIERISDPAKVQQEIDVYNELVPGEGELSATLFIEITDSPRIRAELDRLIGIDEHVALVLGSGESESVVRALFDPKQMEEERISAVQYIRFTLGAELVERFADPETPLRVRIDHPNYEREVVVPAPVRESLLRTLREEPTPLLDVDAIASSAEDEVLFVGEHVRAVRPGRRPGPDRIVVEALEPGGDLARAPAALVEEAARVVQRFAAELSAKWGRCRVWTDLGPEVDRLRWEIHPPRR